MADEPKVETIRSLLTQISTAIAEINDRKEEIVREALQEACPMKGCEARVRTARWVVTMGGSPPFVERLVLMCDAGHEWYQKISTDIDGSKVRLTSTRIPAPFEADLFREMEAAVEEGLGHKVFDPPPDGVWVDAPWYEVGDEILIGGHTPAVVTAVWVDADGVRRLDLRAEVQRPPDFVLLHRGVSDPAERPDPIIGPALDVFSKTENSREEVRVRIQLASEMICPECRSSLRFVPAREWHPAYAADDLARKCTNPGCSFICYQGDSE